MRRMGARMYKVGKKGGGGRLARLAERGGRAFDRFGRFQEGFSEGQDIGQLSPEIIKSADYLNKQKSGNLGAQLERAKTQNQDQEQGFDQDQDALSAKERAKKELKPEEEQEAKGRIAQLKKKARDKIDKAKEKIEQKTVAPIRAGTSGLLRKAWLALIPSWGLSIIWIYIHGLLGVIISQKIFCKYGYEWIPKEILDKGGDEGKKLGEAFHTIESIIIGILSLIFGVIVLGVLVILVMRADFMGAEWYEVPFRFIGGLTKIGWTGIKALFQLFAPSILK